MFLTTIIFLSIDDYDLLYFIKTKLTFLLSDLWLLVCLLTFIWFDILDL